MAYKLKRDHLINWDMQESSDKPSLYDDQDTFYISERSSVASSRELTPVPSPKIKRSPTPPPPPPQISPVAPKEPHTLRYYYNELPENGVPVATQVKQAKKEDKKRQKNFRKAPPGQGHLAPLPETTQSGIPELYRPFWRTYQEKNPDYILRHRQTTDGQIIPYDSFDPTPYIHKPAVADPITKPRRHHRKSRRRQDPLTTQYAVDRMIERVPPQDHYVSLKDPDNEDYSFQSNKRSEPQQNGKIKTDNDQRRTSKTSEDSKTINSNSLDGSNNHHHHHHHRHHRHHHHHHHKHHQSPPVKQYVDTEFKVIDASFKKTERSPYFQEKQKPTHPPPPPAIYHQNSFLPPIQRENYRSPSLNDYYGTQTFHRDWMNSPKIYKSTPQTNFYDRYLNTIIDKRLST